MIVRTDAEIRGLHHFRGGVCRDGEDDGEGAILDGVVRRAKPLRPELAPLRLPGGTITRRKRGRARTKNALGADRTLKRNSDSIQGKKT